MLICFEKLFLQPQHYIGCTSFWFVVRFLLYFFGCTVLSAWHVMPWVHVISCLVVCWYPATSVYFAQPFITQMFSPECMFCTAFHVLFWVHVLHCLLCPVLSVCFALSSMSSPECMFALPCRVLMSFLEHISCTSLWCTDVLPLPRVVF